MQRWRRCSRLELDMAGATPDLGSSPARRQPIFLDRVRGRWFGAVVHYPNSWTGYLRYCLVFALIAGLGGLSVLGHASLPDSLGLPGIYDDADYDDVVALLTDTASLRNFPLVAVAHVHLLLGLVSFGVASATRDASLLGFHLRSPPSA
jgi:hypothetical protein